MPPLSLEMYESNSQKWVLLGAILKPGDPLGSLSQNLPDGIREVYLFECAHDDSHSTIYKSPFGFDVDTGAGRTVYKPKDADWDLVKELKKGDLPYDLTIRNDYDSQGRIIRFTHI